MLPLWKLTTPSLRDLLKFGAFLISNKVHHLSPTCQYGTIGLLQLTVTWYKICHAGGQAYYYSRTGTVKQCQFILSSLNFLCFGILLFCKNCFIKLFGLIVRSSCFFFLLTWTKKRTSIRQLSNAIMLSSCFILFLSLLADFFGFGFLF